MKDVEKKVRVEWYDNPSIITNLLIGMIAIIIILSQSFAIHNNLSTQAILSSIINHNSVYLLLLVYFVALKTRVGKRYFDFLNVFLILLYFIMGITSILTVFQSFSLETLIDCCLHLTLFVYLFHTLFRRSKIWREFHLNKSPFNEISNDSYFYAMITFTVVLWAIELISTTTKDGTILACLDAFFMMLFARYIYLYGCFLENKSKKIKTANIDDIKEKVEEVKDKLDEVVEDIADSVEDVTKSLGKTVSNKLDSEDRKKVKKGSNKKIAKEKYSKKRGDK